MRVKTLAVVFVAALALAACGSSGTKSTSSDQSSSTTSTTSSGGGADGVTATTPTTATSTATGASVSVAESSLGSIVVDSQGLTLYLYAKDTGATSTCTGACATAWPPATVTGMPTAGSGVTGTLTTFTRADGSTQLVLNGHPLYRFAADAAAGDTAGQGLADVWNVVSPSGDKVT